jgi:hypothetical protein
MRQTVARGTQPETAEAGTDHQQPGTAARWAEVRKRQADLNRKRIELLAAGTPLYPQPRATAEPAAPAELKPARRQIRHTEPDDAAETIAAWRQRGWR